jgi:hypothetical protein
MYIYSFIFVKRDSNQINQMNRIYTYIYIYIYISIKIDDKLLLNPTHLLY